MDSLVFLLKLFKKFVYASVGVHVFLPRKEAESQKQQRVSKCNLILGLHLQSQIALLRRPQIRSGNS